MVIPLTVVVYFAIVVLVPVFHQLLDVILGNCLSCRFQHHFQLIQVNVTICIPAESKEAKYIKTRNKPKLSFTDGCGGGGGVFVSDM